MKPQIGISNLFEYVPIYISGLLFSINMKISPIHKSILAIYLFGSRATGNSGKLSDIDIAVLLRKMPSDIGKLKLILISKFIDVFKSDKKGNLFF